ncbi:4-hydroxybenzoate octaprenyltransferase [Hyperthermus butylicus]|uniref:4-hydroxybenzoate polyprenyltransferase n=1 Tax=Hyperthermus butylicus (strain DSM 5456 / JCM 9403 / PLM1-5) TaxID=415426 RepID=A2BMV0_HYPBU|nr:4-hydroxybenzoate octaprenyltransferase [Hyperthermus butylicus]ABM81311.1 4-hydroxybenzoate polyprenyltransferase [Hyperthermus butylicus DSM 5456]
MGSQGAPAAWDPGRLGGRAGRLRALARLIRIEHTLFSLPFAYAGALIACPERLDARTVVLIALAVFGLRTAAMAYNNIADLDIDQLNPRTRHRPLVIGVVRIRDAWLLVFAGSLLYYASAALLNRYALLLSPLPWLLAMSYPHAKRVHWVPHIHLGIVLGLVVFGGAVATAGMEATGLIDVLRAVPWLLVAAVTLWVAGFDTYYAIMDLEFDRKMGLGSIPARLGVKGAFAASRLMHCATAILLAWSIHAYGLGVIAAASAIIAIGLLAYQHLLIARKGLGAIPEAFNTNLLLGLVISLGIAADVLARLA